MHDIERQTRQIFLLIEYNGTGYLGWQRQASVPTVQAEIEATIFKITNENVALSVAGRTDAGVHARGQVASFFTRSTLPSNRFARALNHFLPHDICIHQAVQVDPDIHVRRSSQGKHYSYLIYQSPQRSAMIHQRSWWQRHPLDIDKMQKAAILLTGEHDYEAFRSVHCDAAHAIRRIDSIQITSHPYPPQGLNIRIDIHGNAFCRHMCRIIVGTLTQVGQHQRTVDSITKALQQRKRHLAGVTAPASGLTLQKIQYSQEIFSPTAHPPQPTQP